MFFPLGIYERICTPESSGVESGLDRATAPQVSRAMAFSRGLTRTSWMFPGAIYGLQYPGKLGLADLAHEVSRKLGHENDSLASPIGRPNDCGGDVERRFFSGTPCAATLQKRKIVRIRRVITSL